MLHCPQERSYRCSRPNGPFWPPRLPWALAAIHLSPAGVLCTPSAPAACFPSSLRNSFLLLPDSPSSGKMCPHTLSGPLPKLYFAVTSVTHHTALGSRSFFGMGPSVLRKPSRLSEVTQASEDQSCLLPEPGLFRANRLDHVSQRLSRPGPWPSFPVAQLLFQEGAVGPAWVSHPWRSA